MIRVYTSVSYTCDDLNGFTFKDKHDKSVNSRLALHAFLLFIFILLFCLFLYLVHIELIILALVISVFNLLSLIYCKVHFKVFYAEVIILERLPIENVKTTIDNKLFSFYPVLCKDITSGYESVCYIDESSYSNCSLGDKIKIYNYDKSYENIKIRRELLKGEID